MAGNWWYKIGLGHWHGVYLKRKFFTEDLLKSLMETITQSEERHAGELVLAVEAQPPVEGVLSHERALEVFGRLKVWDTPYRTGILLYLNLSLHTIEIIADRGIVVADEQWQTVCSHLSQSLRQAHYESGLKKAIEEIEVLLAQACQHLPMDADNALSNQPVML